MRRRLLEITPQVLCLFMHQGKHHYEVVENGLPKDVSVVGCKVVDNGFIGREVLRLVLESETFPEASENSPLPVHPAVVFKSLE